MSEQINNISKDYRISMLELMDRMIMHSMISSIQWDSMIDKIDQYNGPWDIANKNPFRYIGRDLIFGVRRR